MPGRSLRRDATRSFAEEVAVSLARHDSMLLDIITRLSWYLPQATTSRPDDMAGGDREVNAATMDFWKSQGYRAHLTAGGTLQVTPVTTLELYSALPGAGVEDKLVSMPALPGSVVGAVEKPSGIGDVTPMFIEKLHTPEPLYHAESSLSKVAAPKEGGYDSLDSDDDIPPLEEVSMAYHSAAPGFDDDDEGSSDYDDLPPLEEFLPYSSGADATSSSKVSSPTRPMKSVTFEQDAAAASSAAAAAASPAVSGTLDVNNGEEGEGKLYCGLRLDRDRSMAGISGVCSANNVQCPTCKEYQAETLRVSCRQ